MKYNININQLAIIENKADIDLYDAAILSFVSDWIGNSSATIVNYNGMPYTWISHKLITDQLPLLRTRNSGKLKPMSKDTIYRRMKRLCNIGLLDKHPNSQKLGMPLYRGTENLDSIKYGAISVPTGLDPKGYGARSEGATGLDPNYNTIKDNTINNNKEREKKEISPQLDTNDSPKDLKEEPKKKSSAKRKKVGIPSPNYPPEYSQELITACEAYFEHRKQIGSPFSSKNAKQTKVLQTTAQVGEYGESKVIASFYEAITEGWKMNYIRKDKKTNNHGKQTSSKRGNESLSIEELFNLIDEGSSESGF